MRLSSVNSILTQCPTSRRKPRALCRVTSQALWRSSRHSPLTSSPRRRRRGCPRQSQQDPPKTSSSEVLLPEEEKEATPRISYFCFKTFSQFLLFFFVSMANLWLTVPVIDRQAAQCRIYNRSVNDSINKNMSTLAYQRPHFARATMSNSIAHPSRSI